VSFAASELASELTEGGFELTTYVINRRHELTSTVRP
jgi:hypothetical protein